MRSKQFTGRLASVLLALALALAIGGCGKSKPAEAPAEEPAKAPAQAPAAADQKKPEAPAATDAKAAKVNPDKLHYIMETTTPDEGKIRMELMVEKPRMKMKVSGMDEGQESAMNVVCDGEFMYMLQDEAKMAIKMPMNDDTMADLMPNQEDFSLTFEGYKKEAGDHITEKGTADFHGQKVKVYEVEEPMSKSKVQVYVDDHDLVRRIEYTDPETKAVTSTEIIQIETDPKFSADEFKVPAGYTIQDMSGVMAPPH